MNRPTGVGQTAAVPATPDLFDDQPADAAADQRRDALLADLDRWVQQGWLRELDRSFALENQGDADARDNKIWSLGATWAVGPHSFTVAHQRSTGDTGYLYGGYRNAGGIGDGGNTILLANSYWSDFNGKDERSWQAGYGRSSPGQRRGPRQR